MTIILALMTKTPRTDAARDATCIPYHEYEGAEEEAWAFAEKLELELRKLEIERDELLRG